mmetsp:Transcript_73174/g.136754  ORF Transcript_73174/g.136754 Transcript_73174/m.136754 type:complete len:190 (+) Transcript_73174:97-666(+)
MAGRQASSSSSMPADTRQGASECCSVEPPRHQMWGAVELSDNSSEQSHRLSGVVIHEESEDSCPLTRQSTLQDAGLDHDGQQDDLDLLKREEAEQEERGPSWSEGAKLHNDGSCRPCAWHWRPAGCSQGDKCTFCHLCDAGALKARKKERAIAAMKAGTPTPQQQRRQLWARRHLFMAQDQKKQTPSAS